MKILLVCISAWTYLTGVWIYMDEYLLAGATGVLGAAYAVLLIRDFKDRKNS